MAKTKKVNKNRSKLFGVVINPKLDERMNWESLSSLEVEEKLLTIGSIFCKDFKNFFKLVNISALINTCK